MQSTVPEEQRKWEMCPNTAVKAVVTANDKTAIDTSAYQLHGV